MDVQTNATNAIGFPQAPDRVLETLTALQAGEAAAFSTGTARYPAAGMR